MTYNDADLEASETNSVTGTTETWFYDREWPPRLRLI